MNSLRLCGGSAATTDMLAMKRTFMWHRLRAAADDADRLLRGGWIAAGRPGNIDGWSAGGLAGVGCPRAESHCREASDLAGWLELGSAVREPLLQAFERWDGRGVPGSVGGDDLAPAIRLVHLADSVEAFHHAGGAEAALQVARERRGTQFDPGLVDRFCARYAEILAGLGGIAAWDEVIALDPQLGAVLSD